MQIDDDYQKLIDEISTRIELMVEKYGPLPPLPQTQEERKAFGDRIRMRAQKARERVKRSEVYRFDGIRGLARIEGATDEIEEQLPSIFEAIHRRLPENCYVDRFPGCKSFQVRNSGDRVILVARHVDCNGIMDYLSKYQGQQVNQAMLDKELAIGLELKLRGNDIDIVDVNVDVWNSSHD
jgi:hypothetical protein